MARFADPVTLPEPWQPATDRIDWSADRARLDETGTLAAASPPPWPQLATIGMDCKGQWRLLNLEALGVVSITGDPCTAPIWPATWCRAGRRPWVRDLQLDCVGACAELASLNPARVGYHDTGTVIDQVIAAAAGISDRLDSTATKRLETA